VFVLLHSPLVGPFTWAPVADELRRRGVDAIIPTLDSPTAPGSRYWERHGRTVAEALEDVAPQQPLILAGHSGAGMLLPAIRQLTRRPVAAYLFVDAGIPEDGKSRLDLFEDPQAAELFRRAAVGGLLPTWKEEDLRAAIPDHERRQRFVAELRPLPLAVYEEPIPVFEGWPDAPCGYVRFGANPAYDAPAERARRAGWPYRELAGAHFHMLVDPAAVAGALLDLVEQLRGSAVRGDK